MAIERIQLRRGTAQQWTDTNPILAAAEVGVELGTPNQFKIGDGSSTWSELDYFSPSGGLDFIPTSEKGAANGVATLDINGAIPTGQLANIIDSAPEALNTLSELAAALADDADFATTVTNALAGKADASHTHVKTDITDFSHTHTKSEITDFAHTHVLADVTDITATATELNYVDGVTSSVQTQLDSKAAASHTHDASEITNTVNTITATTYTIQGSDNGKMLVLDPAGGTITITVDDVFTPGNRVDLYLRGTGVTFSAGTGQIESAGTTMATQYTVASIVCVASGIYAIVGSVE